ncbi:MAG: PBP1A family penicillin-binding protein [Spirochaetes bacterium]|jgi:penicillin-binding protein 1A|nr:PBP1A family penicillin-binding protein [Spirochaetota bacterium]
MENDTKFTLFGKIIAIILLLGTITGGVIFGYIVSEVKNFSGIDNIKQFQLSVPTRLYDVNGELIAELFREKRELISFDEIPQTLINALLATEDQAFYNHFGINFEAIARAMIKNIQAGQIVQGGSTITQQLAKRLFTESEKTYGRKALEAILALQIERKFSKEEILEMYFNQIYLGHGCYGVATTARLFFNKEVKYLSVAESAIIAALPSAPGRYSPLMNPRNAYEKNRDILTRMVDQNYLTKERADTIYREFWPEFIESIKTEFPTKTAHTKITDKAPHFTSYIRQILENRFGRDAVYNDGLIVYTTLDLRRQRSAEKHLQTDLEIQTRLSDSLNAYTRGSVDRGLFGTYGLLRMIFSLPGVIIKHDIESRTRRAIVDELVDATDILTLLTDSRINQNAIETFRSTSALGVTSNLEVEGALVSIEPSTGYITAMVGGSDFNVDNQLNRAVSARRQPGSAFKPFVYGAGIDSKIITSGTTISDAPLVNIDSHGTTWSPGNYGGNYSGLVNIKHALAQSINIVAVRIYDMIGPEKITAFSSNILKVPPLRFNSNPTMALGTSELTPFEMAGAYAIYANRGRDVIPHGIRLVLDKDGNEIANIEREIGDILAIKERNNEMQVIPEEVAFIMTDLMRGVIDKGTARKTIREVHRFTHPAAGKTGTTSNWTDAWFCGFTPDIVTVIWVGYDKPFLSLGKHQAGGVVAAPIWAKYMKDVYNGMPRPTFPPAPENVYKNGDLYYIKGTHGSGGGSRMKMESIFDDYKDE